jgi:rSAM/selenodomain-associated transferase 2
MLSIVIPSLNAAARLPLCLEALVEPAVSGLVTQVIVVDGGSEDDSVAIADGFGATVLTAPPGRGGQLKKGAEAAASAFLLFLHADTVLETGWADEARGLISGGEARAGVFTLAFDATGFAPRLICAGAMVRTRMFKAPYGDQGLLVSRALYDAVGGYANMALFEDVDIIRRIIAHENRAALHVFKSKAVTDAVRYQRRGYFRQATTNLWRLMRYHAGASPEQLAKSYR